MDTEELHATLNALMMHGPWHYYRLEGHTPVRCDDWMEWATAHHASDWHVAQDRGDGWHLSTVFLGQGMVIDGYQLDLFETMLFDDDGQARNLGCYATWEEALHGHRVWLGKIRRLLQENDEL